MAITASFKLKAKQYDAVNAFINSLMNEELYVDFPEGTKQPTHVINPCLLLLRALYGLKQSPLLRLKVRVSPALEREVPTERFSIAARCCPNYPEIFRAVVFSNAVPVDFNTSLINLHIRME